MRIEAESTVDLGNGIFLNLITGCTEERFLYVPPTVELNKEWQPTREEIMSDLRRYGYSSY